MVHMKKNLKKKISIKKRIQPVLVQLPPEADP